MRRTIYVVVAAAVILTAAVTTGLLITRPTSSRAPLWLQTAGPYTVKATPGSASVGQTISLTLTVQGPGTSNSCRPYDIWVTNSSGRQVWRLIQFWACPALGTLKIPAGKSVSFTYEWRTVGMAPGTYTVHGTFNPGAGMTVRALPVVTVTLTD